MEKDYYKILGVEKSADQETIKKTYRKKALKLHPDRNQDNPKAEDQFKELSEAYAILSDPEKRKEYDMYGTQGFQQRYKGEDIYRGSDINDILRDMGYGDLFSRIFGGSQRTQFKSGPSARTTRTSGSNAGGFDFSFFGDQAAAKGADLAYELPVTLEEAFSGASKTVAYRRANGQMEKISVKVPPGVATGTKLRLAGKGEKGPQGTPDGDLLIKIKVQENKLYARHQDDLEMEYKVSFSQAALGHKLEVPTPDGKTLAVKLAPGSASGSRLRLKGQGMPKFNAKGRGDLFVKIQIDVPNKLTDKQKQLLEQLNQEGL